MGDAFLAQPDDVMDSVQRLRGRAQQAGNLKSNEQIARYLRRPSRPRRRHRDDGGRAAGRASARMIVIAAPAQPSVVSCRRTTRRSSTDRGRPAYPPYYYPPPPGYWWSRTIATGIAWGVGIGVKAMWLCGGPRSGASSVDINVNRYNNINVNRRLDQQQPDAWNHNTAHRGNTPYRGRDATRKNLDNGASGANREQFRGKDAEAATPVASAPTRRCRTAAWRRQVGGARQGAGCGPVGGARQGAGRGQSRAARQGAGRGRVGGARQGAERGPRRRATGAERGSRCGTGRRAQARPADDALQGRAQPAGRRTGRPRQGEPDGCAACGGGGGGAARASGGARCAPIGGRGRRGRRGWWSAGGRRRWRWRRWRGVEQGWTRT